MLRVVVVEDHPVVREGLKRILNDSSGIEVVGEASDGEHALGAVKDHPCDAVLLDVALPKRSGLDVLKDIRASYPKMPVLILSMHPEDQYAIRMLKAGAAGYLNKETVPSDLVNAIRKVVRGGRYISPALAEKLALDLVTESDKPPHEKLSDREYQVLCLLASGKTVSEIAAEYNLSVKTISTYRVRLLEKLQLRNNADITRYALSQGLVQ